MSAKGPDDANVNVNVVREEETIGWTNELEWVGEELLETLA